MYSDAIHESVLELVWSLWTELGVPGVSRKHSRTVLDPEALIIATPTLGALDPRLLEQAAGWCVAHAARISTSRLKGLLSRSPEPVVARFSSFSCSLRDRGVRWPVLGRLAPLPLPERLASPTLPLERAALLRFRLRALCGVGARADVLGRLLLPDGVWWSASEMAHMGYTKRNVARILAELADAGIVASRAEGNSRRFQLAHSSSLRVLVGANGLAAPSWRLLFRVLLRILDLLGHELASAAVRRVEASKLRERLVQPCLLLDLEPPPPTRGRPDAWDTLVDWGERLARDVAAGRTPGFDRLHEDRYE